MRGPTNTASSELLLTPYYHTQKQVDTAQKLADGDLTVNFDIRSKKDLLGKALSHVVDNLNNLQRRYNRLQPGIGQCRYALKTPTLNYPRVSRSRPAPYSS
jgi:hypothetical protein